MSACQHERDIMKDRGDDIFCKHCGEQLPWLTPPHGGYQAPPAPLDELIALLQEHAHSLGPVKCALAMYQAADALVRQRARIVKLERENSREYLRGRDAEIQARTVVANGVTWADRAKEAQAALAPFVAAYKKAADPIGDSDLYDEQPRSVHVTLGDCRRAERALK